MDLNLAGKCVLVTGGTRNLGAAMVAGFLQERANVIAAYHQNDAAAAKFISGLPSYLRSNVLIRKVDISSDAACRELCLLARQQFGRLDVLVNNAAVNISGNPDAVTDDDFDFVLRNTLRSTVYMTRAAFSVMKQVGGGRIVNLSTAGVHTANPDELLYLCAKSGVEGCTRAFARQGAPHKITVNAVAPHVISSGMGLETVARDPTIVSRIPLGRMGRVDELVSLILFLSSECCEYLTGQVVHLNGGRLMR